MTDDLEFRDAGCEPGLPLAVHVEDQDVPYLVLFADVDWDDLDALARRAAEWRTLFAGGTDLEQ